MTWRKDLYQELAAATSLTPAARSANTAVNGTGVDLQNYGGNVVLIVAGTITDGTHAFKIQDSADNSSFADAAAADVVGSLTSFTSATTAGTVREASYIGAARYIRVVATTSGATTGGLFSAVVVRGRPRTLPA
jgi:hypothetical protein